MVQTKKDTGYAWVILCACFANNFVSSFNFYSPAIYMIEWQEQFQTNKAQVSVISAMTGSLGCLTALFLAPIINKYGPRPVTITGTTLVVLGSISSLFVKSVWWLYITFGVILAIGAGMVLYPPYVIIQHYFDKKRALAAGVAILGKSLGGVVCLPLLSLLIHEYGWRGALLIQAGLMLHLYPISILYEKLTVQNQEDGKDEKNMCKNIIKYIYLLKNSVFARFLSSILLSFLAVDYMLKFTPMRAISLGMNKLHAILLSAIATCAITLTRLPISFLANSKCVNRTILYGVSIVLAGVVVIVSVCAKDFKWNAVSMILFGICYSTGTTIETTTMVDLIGLEEVAQGQSYNVTGRGIAYMISLSIAGVLADSTNNLNITNYAYGALQVLAGVIILTIPITNRPKSSYEAIEDGDSDNSLDSGQIESYNKQISFDGHS